MNTAPAGKRFPRSSPYWPVLVQPRLRRLLPGLVVSAIGDGMSLVAISWLALELAPPGQRATWIATAVAAYSLPSALGAVLFGRLLRGRGGAQLTGWSATLRAVSLAAVAVVHATGQLNVAVLVVLLAVSSLLAAWGWAGRYTLVAEALPAEHHVPANALITTISEVATIVGPPLAGLLIGWTNAAVVIAVDALSFAVLAVTCRLLVPATGPAGRPESSSAGFRVIFRDRTLLGMLALSFGFFFLFGPVYPALPIHVTEDLGASATVLGAFYTAFGVGAAVGGLAGGYLRGWPLWPSVIGVVLAFGAAMLPLGLGVPTGVALACLALAGAVWAPFPAISIAYFQRNTPRDRLAPVLAANTSLLILAVPLGSVSGGPLVSIMGARPTLLTCAVAIICLGAVAAAVRFTRAVIRTGST